MTVNSQQQCVEVLWQIPLELPGFPDWLVVPSDHWAFLTQFGELEARDNRPPVGSLWFLAESRKKFPLLNTYPLLHTPCRPPWAATHEGQKFLIQNKSVRNSFGESFWDALSAGSWRKTFSDEAAGWLFLETYPIILFPGTLPSEGCNRGEDACFILLITLYYWTCFGL